MKAPDGRLSGDGSTQVRRHGGAFGGSYPKSFCTPPNFVVLRKFVLNMIKIKIFPHKNVFPPKP